MTASCHGIVVNIMTQCKGWTALSIGDRVFFFGRICVGSLGLCVHPGRFGRAAADKTQEQGSGSDPQLRSTSGTTLGCRQVVRARCHIPGVDVLSQLSREHYSKDSFYGPGPFSLSNTRCRNEAQRSNPA